MADKQFYGVKYPFVNQDNENYFIDLNTSVKDKVRSGLMHLIFTPKGQKLRDPEFGTNLIKYIFEPNDSMTWSSIINEISETVNKYISNIKINNVDVMKSEDDFGEIYVRLDYSVTNGNVTYKDSIVTTI